MNAGYHSWSEALSSYRQPRVVAMLFLGFSAGLPLALVFGTLSAWLRDAGVDRSTIGHISWVALAYSVKFAWAPIIDRLALPFLTRHFGQRRSWMLVAQTGVAFGLAMMAVTQPLDNLQSMVIFALIVAFCSATQDITIDAWRIESADVEYQGAMAGMYQTGYRIAYQLVAGAAVLYIAEFINWPTAYILMSMCMGVGIITTLMISEPSHTVDRDTWKDEQRVIDFLQSSAHLPAAVKHASAWFIGAVVCPFSEFFSRNGKFALIMLLFIGVFRLSDITLGIMSMPFYLDMGYTKTEIANISKVFGMIMVILGAVGGGALIVRYGVMRILLISAILVALTNMTFCWLSIIGKDIVWLAVIISMDNLAAGLAGSAFIAYLSSLTNRAYTATQYALFSSLMLLPAKFIGGFSGDIVDTYGYVNFFIYSAALGLPAIALIIYLMNNPVESK